MNYYVLLPLVAFCANLSLGVYILYRNSQSSLNRIYSMFAFALGIWCLGDIFIFSAFLSGTEYDWIQFGSIGSLLMPAFLLHFCLVFSKRNIILKKTVTMFLYLPGLCLIFISHTVGFVGGALKPTYWGYAATPGIMYPVEITYIIGYVGIAIFYISRLYFKTSFTNEKKQIALITAGLSIPLIGGIITEAIPSLIGFEIVPLSTTLTTITAVIIAYTIIKYGLMTSLTFSIQRKFIVWFLIIALLVGFVGGIGLYSSQQSSSLYADFGGDFAAFSNAATEITSYSKQAEEQLTLYLMLGNDVNRDNFYQRQGVLNKEIDTIEEFITTQQQDQINILRNYSADILNLGEQLLQEYDKNPTSFTFKEYEEVFREFHDATSTARQAGVELAKVGRELFLDQLAVNANTEITSYSTRAEGHLLLYLAFGNETDREKFFIRIDSLNDNIELLKTTVNSSAEAATVQSMEGGVADILKYGKLLLVEYDKNQELFNATNHTELITEFHNASAVVREKGVEFSDNKLEKIAASTEAVDKSVKDIQRIMLIIIFVAIAATVGFSYFISQSISKPIIRLKDTAKNISKGNFDTKLQMIKIKKQMKELEDRLSGGK